MNDLSILWIYTNVLLLVTQLLMSFMYGLIRDINKQIFNVLSAKASLQRQSGFILTKSWVIPWLITKNSSEFHSLFSFHNSQLLISTSEYPTGSYIENAAPEVLTHPRKLQAQALKITLIVTISCTIDKRAKILEEAKVTSGPARCILRMTASLAKSNG